MTKREIEAIRLIASRIDKLSSMERASFAFNKEEDAKIKKTIAPYMQWFCCCSMYLKRLANAEELNDKYAKMDALEDIERYCL